MGAENSMKVVRSTRGRILKKGEMQKEQLANVATKVGHKISEIGEKGKFSRNHQKKGKGKKRPLVEAERERKKGGNFELETGHN